MNTDRHAVSSTVTLSGLMVTVVVLKMNLHYTKLGSKVWHSIKTDFVTFAVKPRFNVPTFSEIPDLVMIFSCPDNSSI